MTHTVTKPLVHVAAMRPNAGMSKRVKTAKKTASDTLRIIEDQEREKDGVKWTTNVVEWRENGKRCRKQFSDLSDAKAFKAEKFVELENQGRDLHRVWSHLSNDQIDEAAKSFSRLGNAYSLTEAVDYFLKNHRAPDFTLSLKDASSVYLDERERDGLRDRTITNLKSSLRQFQEEMENDEVHEVTPERVESFLRGLRAKDGITIASRKTWNNVRNELNHFFKFANVKDITTHRPWIFHNPVEEIRYYTAKQVAEQRDEIVTSEVEKVQQFLSVLMRWRDGRLVKPFALAYFAGIRPDMTGELGKLSARENELINLKTNIITIPPSVSKTKELRKVTITPNLRQWLLAYRDFPIKPKNWDKITKKARKHFTYARDETRHTFISYHVAKNRSVGEAALQAGNSEKVVKEHYLNLLPREDGEAFFSLVPDMSARRAVRAPQELQQLQAPHLKAI